MSNGRVFKVPSYFSTSRTLQVGEAFQIDRGKIRQIEMTLTEIPYGSRPAWPAADYDPASPAPSGLQPARAGAGPCDRKCLKDLAGQLLAAVAAHDPVRAPLSPSAGYFENGQRLRFGDGLWRTVTRIGDYRVYALDSDAGRIGFLGAITETDVSGALALSVKVENHQIQEIHAAAVREEKAGRNGTMTLFRPRLLAEFDPAHFVRPDAALMEIVAPADRSAREEAAAIVRRYFEGTQLGKADAIPFDEHCDRYDNGVRTTNNPQAPALDPGSPAFRPFSLACAGQTDGGFHNAIFKIRNPGPWVVDRELGLVFGIAFIDISGTVRSLDIAGVGKVALPPSFGVPHTWISPYLFKIRNGKIRRIETLTRPVPYGWLTLKPFVESRN